MNKSNNDKPDLAAVQNIVFDLGNVLLNLDFDASIRAFKELGMEDEVLNREQAYIDPVFYELEVGRIPTEVFRERVRELLKNPAVTDRQIDDAWCAMIGDVPASRVQVVRKLSEEFKVYLFSNTNPIHIERLQKQFRQAHGMEFSSLFLKACYSHQLHERKPDLTSYRKMMELAGIEPWETLFIDDLEKNIRGAQDAGMKTFWLRNGMELTQLF